MSGGLPSSDAGRVRVLLMRSLETLNLLESFAESAQGSRLRELCALLADSAREHVTACSIVVEELHGAARPAPPSSVAPSPAPSFSGRLPERLPEDPRRILQALPAPPGYGGALTVGVLKRPGDLPEP